VRLLQISVDFETALFEVYAYLPDFCVRLKGSEKHDCRTLAECDSCIKHGFKMRFFLTVFSLQPIHLSNYHFGYYFFKDIFHGQIGGVNYNTIRGGLQRRDGAR